MEGDQPGLDVLRRKVTAWDGRSPGGGRLADLLHAAECAIRETTEAVVSIPSGTQLR